MKFTFVIVLFAILIWIIPIQATLVASGSFQPISGDSPLSVKFTDTSTGNPVKWFWNFGDGGTSIDQNSTHVYSNPGTYSVTLIVSDNEGKDIQTLSFKDSVVVNKKGTSIVTVQSAITAIIAATKAKMNIIPTILKFFSIQIQNKSQIPLQTAKIIGTLNLRSTYNSGQLQALVQTTVGKEILYSDNFDTYQTGILPTGWQGCGYIDNKKAYSTPNVVKLDASGGLCTITKALPKIGSNSDIFVEGYILTGTNPDSEFGFASGTNNNGYGRVQLVQTGSTYTLYGGSKKRSFSPNTWIKVKIYSNFSTRKQTIWIDDQIWVNNDPSDLEKSGLPDKLRINVNNEFGSDCTLRFDDIKLG